MIQPNTEPEGLTPAERQRLAALLKAEGIHKIAARLRMGRETVLRLAYECGAVRRGTVLAAREFLAVVP